MTSGSGLSLVGLAQRAGKIVSGDATLETYLRRGDGALLIIAADCGRNNREKYEHLAKREHIPYLVHGTAEELGQAVGKARRVALLVTDAGLAAAIRQRLDE